MTYVNTILHMLALAGRWGGRGVIVGVMMLAMVGTVRGQAGSLQPYLEPMGPPAPATMEELRTARIAEVSRRGGLSAGAAESVGSKTSGDVPLPDITQMMPTTTDRTKLSNSIQIVILLSLLTLAPSILLMTTCFTRVIIVLSLLRQALGASQLPPNQVLIGLALFITFLVMGPTWQDINTKAIDPYRKGEMSQMEALDCGKEVLRGFMIRQIRAAHNEDDVYLFHSYAHKNGPAPKEWKDIDTTTIVPAFILSELKVAFLMGFRIYLPFLIIDMVISSVLISIGMQLLPPVMVSLPFKLLLFVLVDGWHLVTATLLASFN